MLRSAPRPSPPPSSDRTAIAVAGCLLALGVSLVLIIAAAVLMLRARPGEPTPVAERPVAMQPAPAPTASPAPAPQEPPEESLVWSAHPGLPILADVNGDGVDDLVGCVVVTHRASSAVEARVAAYDGRSFALLWTAGSLGHGAFSCRDVGLAAGHGHVAALDARARYVLFDARTGEEKLRGEAEAPGTEGCATAGDGARRLWVGTRDGQIGVLFDVAAPRATGGARPASCTAGGRLRAEASAARTTLPWIAGSMVKLVTLREGEITFAFGLDDWSRKDVTIAAFGESEIVPLWRRPVRAGAEEAPPMSNDMEGPRAPVDLVGGRAYVVYPIHVDQAPWIAWRMQALEAATGRARWDVALEGSGLSGLFSTPELHVAGERVFVAFDQWLQVHARDTGERLGRVGP